MRLSVRNSNSRKGAVLPLVVVTAMSMICVMALTIDLGYISSVRSELQNAADAAALAGAADLGGGPEIARNTAKSFASKNVAGGVPVLVNDADVTIGSWYYSTQTFVPGATGNAVKVTARRDSTANGPLKLFFAPLMGFPSTPIVVEAIAARMPVDSVNVIPLAVRAPTFGRVHPDVLPTQPGIDGPAYPSNGKSFQIGEKITVLVHDYKGPTDKVDLKKNPNAVYRVNDDMVIDLGLEMNNINFLDVVNGTLPPVPLDALTDQFVRHKGYSHQCVFKATWERYSSPANSPLRDVYLPVVDILPSSRNPQNELTGKVRVVDFVAVHLDGPTYTTIPDPANPNRLINIVILTATVVERSVSGATSTRDPSAVVPTPSVYVLTLVQ